MDGAQMISFPPTVPHKKASQQSSVSRRSLMIQGKKDASHKQRCEESSTVAFHITQTNSGTEQDRSPRRAPGRRTQDERLEPMPTTGEVK